MMNILTRYLLFELGKGYLLAAFALTALFYVFGLVGEIDNLGAGSYRLPHAIWYVGMTSFDRLLNLLPFVSFLGGLLALANLSRHSEMLVMSSAGQSILLTVRVCALAAGFLGLLALLLGELVAPPLYKEAELQRMLLKSGRAELLRGGGFWVRGDHWYLKADRLGEGKDPESVLILEFDPDGPLKRYHRAESAEIREAGRWTLHQVETREFTTTRQRVGSADTQDWAPPSGAREEAGAASESVRADTTERIRPLPLASLSLTQLNARVSALGSAGLSAHDAELLLWQRLLSPLAVLAMGLLAVPLVFGDLRAGTFGTRLAVGSGTGVGVWLLGTLTASTSLLINAPALLSAALPVLLIGLASSVSIWFFGRRV